MFQGNKIVCVVPARGGSKGLPGKNIRRLCGKPLIAHSLAHARQCALIDRVVVSTDSPRIAAVCRRYGADVPFMRPQRLARDSSSTIDALVHCLDWLEKREGQRYDYLVLLHVTAPLRTAQDIGNCIRLAVNRKADVAFSVTPAHRNPYFNMVERGADGRDVRLVKKGNFVSRQQAPEVFDMNASIYVWSVAQLKKYRAVILPRTELYVMPKERSVDIDDIVDFRIVESLMGRKKRCR